MRRSLSRCVLMTALLAVTLHCATSEDPASAETSSAVAFDGANPPSTLTPWEILPADVAAVIHADVESLGDSELFRAMRGRFGEGLDDPTGRYAEFVEATGFQLERDLLSLTLGAPADVTADDRPFYVVLRGRFDRERIDGQMETMPEVRTGDAFGLTTFTTTGDGPDGTPPTTFAWIDASTLIASPASHFDRFAAHLRDARPATAKSAVGTLIRAGRGQLFAAFDVPPGATGSKSVAADGNAPAAGGSFPSVPPQLQELRTVLLSMDVGEDVDLSLVGEAATVQGGEAVEQLVRGYVGMLGMMAQDNVDLQRWLGGLEVAREGAVVRVSLRVAGTDVLEALERQTREAAAPFAIGG